MQQYTFEPKPVALTWWSKLYSWYISIHDNRALYTQFVTDLHLEGKDEDKKSYYLPKKYPIVTSELKRLYAQRDKSILKIYPNGYSDKQVAIDKRLADIKNDRALLVRHAANEEKDMAELKGIYSHEKSPASRIACKANIEKVKSSIRNTELKIKNLDNEELELQLVKKNNKENWKNQIVDIEKTIELEINKYIKRSTKKIETKYGFTDFVHDIAKYDEDLVKKVKGEYVNEKRA